VPATSASLLRVSVFFSFLFLLLPPLTVLMKQRRCPWAVYILRCLCLSPKVAKVSDDKIPAKNNVIDSNFAKSISLELNWNSSWKYLNKVPGEAGITDKELCCTIIANSHTSFHCQKLFQCCRITTVVKLILETVLVISKWMFVCISSFKRVKRTTIRQNTLSITTLSITTFSIKINKLRHSAQLYSA
jgi:hypothetical protein